MADQALAESNTYNAAEDLIGRNLAAGRGDKTAFIDASGAHTFGDVERGTNRFAHVLGTMGLSREARVLLVLDDTVDFPICFLGAMKAGVVSVPANTRSTARDYAYIAADCRAEAIIVSEALLSVVLEEITPADRPRIVVSGADAHGHALLAELLAVEPEEFKTVATTRDDMCFWLYTSGTTGGPKGVVHLHSHLIDTADLYARPVLGINETDIVYSAAKLFFAYGLGNALTFPMAVGATAVLLDEPPVPNVVVDLLRREQVTIFYGVPTLYGMILAGDDLPGPGEHAIRLCVSAGEALPPDLLRRWRERTGTDILDGIGTTEMLHIFISNRLGEVHPGTTGRAVDGYELRLLDDENNEVGPGEIGVLEVSGPTSGLMYWNQRAKTKDTFRGPWTRTGDKYTRDENGIFTYCGRNDDMLKVGGIYVSPFEVEAALVSHEAVLEAAVVGQLDQDELVKPKAFVVLNQGVEASEATAAMLRDFVKNDLAAYKYPRWIEFLEDLPKTATGKIQRFKLRDDG
ncbi:MAG: benzoate-CoA ligase family protein [Rhodospirillaceae bacterium]|nr:benzoate-CoA ligase family protein [Rhodospirillaceae bacterium]MBT6139866.1 benzoate-CoA ligase family protein [Rhodospirillaceae bacterium]